MIIVVDQMRADYVDRFEQDWTRGLGRLAREGARFVNAAYPYLSTYTCAGHSTIATGTFPHRHGNFQNTWYDRQKKAVVPCTDDPSARPIAYLEPGRHGVGPARLREPTFADLMREQRQARVVSLSLKARSAIMLAGHGGHAVTWFGDAPDGWQTSTAFGSTPVAAVAEFVRDRPIEKDFRRVWKRLLPPGRYPGPDGADGEAPLGGWDRTFPHALVGTEGRPDRTFRAQWESSPWGDAYLGALAARLVETERLGRRETTDLLLVGFSSPDLVGHRFGPDSHEVRDLYGHLDRTLGQLFNRIDRLVGRDRYVVALSADHGVADIPEQRQRRGEEAGRVSTATLEQVIEASARTSVGIAASVATVNGGDVYFEPGVYARLQSTRSALDEVVRAVEAQPGVARVFLSEQLVGGTAPSDLLHRAALLSYVPERSGDLVVALKPGWIFGTLPTTHGSGNPYDQRVPVIFWGVGIRAGRYTDPASPADIAPTLAALVGLTMPRAEGRALRAALGDQPTGATAISR